MTHQRWNIVRKRAGVDERAHEVALSYVAGYMQALEDVLRDMDAIRLHEQGRNLKDAAYFEGHTRCWKMVRARTGRTMAEARNTWKAMEKMTQGEGSGTVE